MYNRRMRFAGQHAGAEGGGKKGGEKEAKKEGTADAPIKYAPHHILYVRFPVQIWPYMHFTFTSWYKKRGTSIIHEDDLRGNMPGQ